MPAHDAIRWNTRYVEDNSRWNPPPRSLLTSHQELIPRNGLALDIAMGLGQNSKVLIDRGLKVIGVDISSAAVIKAKRNSPQLNALVADLSEFHFGQVQFDVILNFYYLQRNLFEDIFEYMKPGGILFLETLTEEIITIKPDIDPVYLLKHHEILELLKGWDILYHVEGWLSTNAQKKKPIASVIARKPFLN
jgi:SAM-dependent methyltransferase